MNGPQEMLGELNRVLQQQQQQLQQQQQQNQPDNVEVEDDHDDDEEDDDDDEDDGIDRDADGTLDGGVAGASGASNGDDNSSAVPRRRAADCDLILYITCAETLDDIAPHHPILKQDVCVSIGLDKSTKLGAVFARYAEFCNEHSRTKIEESDLEFFHCQLLNANDTAEASALMKNDRINVRRERTAERETQQELKRLQRESDREYFKQLRHLLPDLGGSRYCDVVFDCRGKHVDESGRNQQVLSTTVRGNSVVLEQRCTWLAGKIEAAREARKAQSVVTLPSPNEVKTDDEDDDEGESQQSCVSFQEEKNIVANTSSGGPEEDDNDEGLHQRRSGSREDMDMEEDDDEILGYPVPKNRPQGAMVRGGGATEIENDYDDDEDGHDSDDNSNADNNRGSRSRSPVMASSNNQRNAANSDLLWVTIPNHSPEAVKLLLEYCYTNRVVPLGQEAFVQACKTKPVKPKDGPVSPYSNSRRWPNGGLPEVSFSVALAGVALAEEAGMHRLSLMCEIAASNLLSGSNVVEALTMCTRQRELTGNPLTRLREVAINVVLRSGPRSARGIYELPTFKRALEERTNSIISTLLTGTMDVLTSSEKKKSEDTIAGEKRQFSTMTENHFNEVDREDRYRRERERRQRRLERWEKDPELAAKHGAYHDAETGEVYCDPVLSNAWAAESARRSLKRMTHNMTVGSFHHTIASRVGGFPSSRAAENLSRAPSNWGVKRRSSSRRRNSERSS